MGEFLNIRAGLYSVLTACGPYSAGEVSTCDFGILSGVSGCAIIYMPGSTRINPQAFGRNPARNDDRLWGIEGEIYVKDTGDPTGFIARCWQAPDDFFTTLNKDGTLAGAADDARITQMDYVGEGRDTAGQLFGVIRFTIVAEKITS